MPSRFQSPRIGHFLVEIFRSATRASLKRVDRFDGEGGSGQLYGAATYHVRVHFGGSLHELIHEILLLLHRDALWFAIPGRGGPSGWSRWRYRNPRRSGGSSPGECRQLLCTGLACQSNAIRVTVSLRGVVPNRTAGKNSAAAKQKKTPFQTGTWEGLAKERQITWNSKTYRNANTVNAKVAKTKNPRPVCHDADLGLG